jgi:hypothetical protein
MDCEKFDALVQEMLDARRIVPLDPAAQWHRQECGECAEYYDLYCQLLKLTEPSADGRRAGLPGSAEPWNRETRVAGGGGEVGVDVRLATAPVVAAAVYPLARTVRRPVRQLWGLSVVSAAVVAAALLITLIRWQLPANDPADLSTMAGSSSGLDETRGQAIDTSSPTADGNPVAGNLLASDPAGTTELDREELRRLAQSWDQSVVAWDRGWQQMAVGRVRAHQIPGIQPAVYPITGAVEAFRKNMIVRKQNGLAAGLRW